MKLAILVLEDEPEVRAALERDLLSFAPTIRIEPAENVDDAKEVMQEIEADGDVLALALCDHRMPGTTGVDFMVDMAAQPATADTRKVLVTGQADLDDTVRAVNQAHLDHFIAKPWTQEDLEDVVRDQLTDYVIATGTNPLPHLAALDQPRALDYMRDYGRAD